MVDQAVQIYNRGVGSAWLWLVVALEEELGYSGGGVESTEPATMPPIARTAGKSARF
jgi:hypothetical protein